MHDHSQRIGIVWDERYPELRPGVLYFECERLSAHLTSDACRKNWIAAHEKVTDETPLRLMKCRHCPTGRALHTDIETPQTWQDVRSSSECVRCGRHDLRLIADTRECVSCWNRRKETERGRNARGGVLQNPVVLRQRRVGLFNDGGKPTWRRFSSWHDGEAISRAVRQVDGAKFHDHQPGISVWNRRVGKFQYRCSLHTGEFGTLRELVGSDGGVEYICPVCKPGRARGLPEAIVCSATSLSSPAFVRESLVKTDAAIHLKEHFAPTAHICDRCQHYAIEARLRNGRVECRCPLCDERMS